MANENKKNDNTKNEKLKGEDAESFDALGDSKLKLGDALKKVFTAGVSAAFMTEEGIKSYLADLKLPKELLNIVLQSANKSKDEITNKISKEMIHILSKIDFVKEASRFAEEHKFKVTAEIEIMKKEPTKKSELKNQEG